MHSQFNKHLFYWILPSATIVLLSLVYFLNVLGLAEVIAPDFNREFGLLENLQLVLLLFIAYICLRKFKNGTEKIEKYGFLIVGLFTVFIFFEEMDYGLHYIDYYNGKTQETVKYEMQVEQKVRNIHNTGKLVGKFKLTSYFIIVLFFVILPLLPVRIKERFAIIRFLSPSRWIVTTATSLLITNQIAFYLYRNHNFFNRSMDSNISEFEETMTYYIILLYLWEMIKKPEGLLFANKRATGTKKEENAEMGSSFL